MTCSVEVNDLLSRPGQMSAPDRLLLTYRHPLTRPTTIRRVQCLLTNSPSAGNAVAGRSRRATTSTAVATTVPEAKPRNLPEFMISFSPAYPRLSPIPNNNTGNDDNPDPNNAKLGKTLRVLQARLPTLLHSPLPQEILSPNISLHLFPSTHPHLPAVRGRVAYRAALWTSPIAWNRFPGLGNITLDILSERMVRKPPQRDGARQEQLVVRWRTIGGTSRGLATYFFPGKDGDTSLEGGKSEAGNLGAEGKEFMGLFIFEFDGEGRVLSHTIEHVEEGGQWEKGVGAKVVGLTDWLLGGFKNGGREGDDTPCPAFATRRQTRTRK